MKKNFISIIVIMLLLLNTIFPIIAQAKESENIITKNMQETKVNIIKLSKEIMLAFVVVTNLIYVLTNH